MKCYTYIDEQHEEEVLIYAKKRTSTIDEIERLAKGDNSFINGTIEGEITKLSPLDIICFISENNKVFAITKDKKYQVKEKLYQLEEEYMDSYVKLNQSCLANIKKIKKYSSTIGGAVMVTFLNGYQDYISRRELKNVKQRMGL